MGLVHRLVLEVECIVSGIGNVSAKLELWAYSLPPEEFSCLASEASGKYTIISVEVEELATTTRTSSTETTTTRGILCCAELLSDQPANHILQS